MMHIKREKLVKIVGDQQRVVQPMDIVYQAVEELEAGKLTYDEAASKYEVRRSTVVVWLRKYGQRPKRDRVTVAEKRSAVRQIESGLITSREVALKYNMNPSTVAQWKKHYSCAMQPRFNDELKGNADALAKEKQSVSANRATEKQLEELHLKIYALETMIDIAEKEFKIEIRKKSGTKQ